MKTWVAPNSYANPAYNDLVLPIQLPLTRVQKHKKDHNPTTTMEHLTALLLTPVTGQIVSSSTTDHSQRLQGTLSAVADTLARKANKRATSSSPCFTKYPSSKAPSIDGYAANVFNLLATLTSVDGFKSHSAIVHQEHQ
jgi:hypothetical protein